MHMFNRLTSFLTCCAFAFAAFASAEKANSELILSVDWDILTPGVQHEIDTVADTIDVHLVVELTGDTNIYAYNFSVRFNSEVFDFEERNQLPRPAGFEDSITQGTSDDFGPDAEQSGGGFFVYRTLGLFNGINYDSELSSNDAPVGAGAVLGRITFKVLKQPTPGTLLVSPGIFDNQLGGDGTFEGFAGLIGGIETRLPLSQIRFQSGSITAVPEPSSLVLFCGGSLGFLALRYRNVRRLRNANKSQD